MSAKFQYFSFYINIPTEVTQVPEKHTLSNQFDYIADLVSLQRLQNETNPEYKQRILDESVHPGSPLYEGVVNNLTRSFGQTRSKALTIDLKTDSTGQTIAVNPRIDILADRVVLYSDWRPDGTEVIDLEISFYSQSNTAYYLSTLVSEINDSTCFSATIDSNVRPNLHSTNLIRGTTNNIIRGDLVEASNKFSLSATRIVQDSLIFTEADIFQTEVLTTPQSTGEYYIDYENGVIELYSIPLGNLEISYHYNIFPLIVDYSLVKVYTLQDDDFMNQLFIQETLESGEEINSLPNTEGSEIFHQLHKETKFFWGE